MCSIVDWVGAGIFGTAMLVMLALAFLIVQAARGKL